MRRLISALAIALLVLGPVCTLLSAEAGASAGMANSMSHGSHDSHTMNMSDGADDGGMDDDCPMTDFGACCGIAGGHCATGVVVGVTISHPAGMAAETVLPEIASVGSGTPADIDIPPPRV